MKNKKHTAVDFSAAKIETCPACGSADIEAVSIPEFFHGYLFNDCECHECGAAFVQQFEFSGCFIKD